MSKNKQEVNKTGKKFFNKKKWREQRYSHKAKGEIPREIPEEIHIRHCMLYEYRKGSNAAVATKNISDIYPLSLNIRKCQRWFSQFKSGNFDLYDSYRSAKPTTFDNEVLKANMEANPNQAIDELSKTVNRPRSTIQKHLQGIKKKKRAGVWVEKSRKMGKPEKKANPKAISEGI